MTVCVSIAFLNKYTQQIAFVKGSSKPLKHKASSKEVNSRNAFGGLVAIV